MVTLEKIMHMGEEIEVGGGGFKNVSNMHYKNGKLHTFEADGKEYELGYNDIGLTNVNVGNKNYHITYTTDGKLQSIQEN